MDLEEAARRLTIVRSLRCDRPVMWSRSASDTGASHDNDRVERHCRRRAYRCCGCDRHGSPRNTTRSRSWSRRQRRPYAGRQMRLTRERVAALALDEVVLPAGAQPVDHSTARRGRERRRVQRLPDFDHAPSRLERAREQRRRVDFLRAHTPTGTIPFSNSGGVGLSGRYPVGTCAFCSSGALSTTRPSPNSN